MSTKIYLYPLLIRIWHLINALAIIFLIITGISLQYSDPLYPFMRFDLAVAIHNICGILLAFNYIIFIVGNIITGNSKHYIFRIKGYISKLMKQSYYYSIGIFKGEAPPFPINESNKFNPLQQFSYVVIMYLVLPILIISGFGLLFPEIVINQLQKTSGIFITDMLHIIGGFIVSIFLFVYIYFCTIGKKPFKNFKSIITGWHEDNH